ncbi:MAG: DNA internalization-related competence protein ComEC/Rec2 [Lachnospiraceae bacterium]|nr:DNA internalization-related competence protein ComEC/Rec2 [Lachnospiraceae bacterium]
MRLTDNLERLVARPMLVFFVCFASAIILIGDSPGGAARGSVLSLGCAVFVLVRIRSGRAGPGEVRAAVIFFTIPVLLFTAAKRTASVLTLSSLRQSLESSATSTECSFFGIITDISIDNDKTLYFIDNASVRSELLDVDGSDGLLSGSVRVTLASRDREDLGVGTYVTGEGKLRALQPASNPGCFDEEAYYATRGIDALITASRISVGSEDSERSMTSRIILGFKSFFTDLRLRAVGALAQNLPEDEAAVLSAMLTGERGLLEEETKDALAAGGIAHILAVSGLHISLISGGIYSLLMRLTGRKKLCCAVTAFMLVLYGVFTGMPVSAARAIIMSSCMLAGRMSGRTYDMISSISLAGLIILFVNPLYIRDSSFIMSFTAVGGVAVGNELLRGARIRSKAAAPFLTIGGVYVFLLPVLMNTYYYVNPYSLLINLIVIPLMSLVVPLGGISILATAIAGSGVSIFASGLCHYLIRGIIWACNLTRGLPFSKVITGHRSDGVLLAYYSVIALVLILVMTLRKKWPMWLLLLCLIIFVKFPNAGTTVHMLDVGQGECIVIEDGTENIIVDAGSSNVSKLYKYRIGPFLRYMGIDRVDRMILTHADSDHKSAMKDLFEDPDVTVGEFICADAYDNGSELADSSPEPCTVREVAAGDVITLESGSRLCVVSPTGREGSTARSDRNDQSVVFEFMGENLTALFTGDSSSKVEAEYLPKLREFRQDEDPGDSQSRAIDLLKVAHHGSKNSTSRALLEAVDPTVGIISASATNRYGHPSKETLERLENAGCSVYTTSRVGYIRLTCSGGNISVMT